MVTTTRIKPAEMARQFGTNVYRDAYESGCTVSQLLERYDPTEEYPEGSDDRQLDAFERVLRAEGLMTCPIESQGIRAATWEEASKTPERRALLHEYCARIWRQVSHGAPMTPMTRSILLSGDVGLNTIDRPWFDDTLLRARPLRIKIPIERVVARTTPIEGDAFRTLYIVDDFGSDAYRMKRVQEGAVIPTTTLVSGEHYLRIHKFGRALRYTYEQLRRQRLDRIGFIVQRMALQAEVDKLGIIIGVIVNGDGNTNTAAPVHNQTTLHAGSAANTLTLRAWLMFQLEFGLAYMPDIVLGQRDSIGDLLLLPIPGAASATAPYALAPNGAFGNLRPLADQLSDGTVYADTSDAPARKLVMFDSSRAVERVVEIGGNVSEVDRFVRDQTHVLTMTEVEGYGTLDPAGSARILDINA